MAPPSSSQLAVNKEDEGHEEKPFRSEKDQESPIALEGGLAKILHAKTKDEKWEGQESRLVSMLGDVRGGI